MTNASAILDRPPRNISDNPENRQSVKDPNKDYWCTPDAELHCEGVPKMERCTSCPLEKEKAQSPFIPGTHIQFAWDSTSIGWAKGCARLYQYMMIEGWRPKEESDDLTFGLEYHSALEEYDREVAGGKEHLIALRQVVRNLLIRTYTWKTTNEYKNRANLLRTVVWYLDKFGDDDTAETLILKDGRPAVEVTFKFELDWGPDFGHRVEHGIEGGNIVEYNLSQPYLLCGHLDRVVTYQGSTFVMDRKTTKSQPTHWYFSNFEPDNQMTLYSFAGKLIFQAPIKGVIIDAAQVQIDKSEFGRGITYRTQDQIDEWLIDLKFLFAQFEDYAAEGYWPMNDKFCGTFRSEASGKIGCPFRSICGSSPQVRENFLKANFTKLEEGERWNPLKAR